MKPKEPIVHCSFCDKTQEEVYKIVAGVNVYICDECITMCAEIIKETQEPVVDYEFLYKELCVAVEKLNAVTKRVAAKVRTDCT